jgi:hypothetical protein
LNQLADEMLHGTPLHVLVASGFDVIFAPESSETAGENVVVTETRVQAVI